MIRTPTSDFWTAFSFLSSNNGDRLAVPAILVAGRERIGLDQDGEILVLDAGEDQRQRGVVERIVGRRGDVAGRVGDDLRSSCPFELAEDHVAEGAGVPLPLDRDAVRPEQVVDDRPFLVGALELEVDLEAVGVREQAEGLGDDHAVLGRGPEDHRLAGDRRLGDGSNRR